MVNRFISYNGESYAWSASTEIITVTEVPIWVEVYPYNTTVREAVLAYGETLSVGSDVDYSVMDQFLEAFYGSSVWLLIGTEDNWVNTNSNDITIDDGYLASFALSRVRGIPA